MAMGGVLGLLTIGVVTDSTNDFSSLLYLLTVVCASLVTLGIVLVKPTRAAGSLREPPIE